MVTTVAEVVFNLKFQSISYPKLSFGLKYCIFYSAFLEPLATIHFHCMEKSNVNILQNICFCVLQKKVSLKRK